MKDITISNETAKQAMEALQACIVQRARRDSLDGAPSHRGRRTVTSRDHSAHSEIAEALGESTMFAISADADPTPDHISQAADLANLLLKFWLHHNHDWARDLDRKFPPYVGSLLADTLARFCHVSPTTARRIAATTAMAMGWELTSMGDWLEVANGKA